MINRYHILRRCSSIFLFAFILSVLSCRHEVPEPTVTIPPPVGKLSEDFFLQGDYILRYSSGSLTYLPSDSMYLRIGPVVNGISIMTWVRGSIVLREEAISDMLINTSFQNAYLWPFPEKTEIYLNYVNGNYTVLLYCWPNYVNYGHTSDSIVYSGSAFDSVGHWFFYKE